MEMDDELEDFLKFSWNICLTKKPSFNENLKKDAGNKKNVAQLKSVSEVKTNVSKKNKTESKKIVSKEKETATQGETQLNKSYVRRKLFDLKDEKEDTPSKTLGSLNSHVESNGNLKKNASSPKEQSRILLISKRTSSPLQNKFKNVHVADKLSNGSDINGTKKAEAAEHPDHVTDNFWNLSLSRVSKYTKNVVEKDEKITKELVSDADIFKNSEKDLGNIAVISNLESKKNSKKQNHKKLLSISEVVVKTLETKENLKNRKQKNSNDLNKGIKKKIRVETESKPTLNGSNRKKLKNQRLNADSLLDDSESFEDNITSNLILLNCSKRLKPIDNFKVVSKFGNDERTREKPLDNSKNASEKIGERIFTQTESYESLKLDEISEPVDDVPFANNGCSKSVELCCRKSTRSLSKNKNEVIESKEDKKPDLKKVQTRGTKKKNIEKQVHSELIKNASNQSTNSKKDIPKTKILSKEKDSEAVNVESKGTRKSLRIKRKSLESSVSGIRTKTSPRDIPAQEILSGGVKKYKQSKRLKTDLNANEQLSSKIIVYDNETCEDIALDCVQRQQFYSFDVAKNETVSIAKILGNKHFATGIMKLGPKEEKGYRFTSGDTLAFWISCGTLEVTIHETTVKLFENDSFYVPAGNGYNVVNLSDDEANLIFFQLKSCAL